MSGTLVFPISYQYQGNYYPEFNIIQSWSNDYGYIYSVTTSYGERVGIAYDWDELRTIVDDLLDGEFA